VNRDRVATGGGLALPPDPNPEYRGMAVALRVGSLLLGAGASTDEVERSMHRVALAAGLAEVQSAVTMGILTMSAVRIADGQPLTQLRIVSERNADYQRLAALADLVTRITDREVSIGAAPGELDRIIRLPPRYSLPVSVLASALSSAAATVLFGGSAVDFMVTLAIGLAVEPIVRRIERSGLPDFFQALLGPLLATALAVALVAVGLPIDGGLVVTGAILRFLPGGALVAGMRDLIDRSIISGSARLAEALLLGSAVAVGTGVAIRAAEALGGPSLEIGEIGTSAAGIVAQSIAAAASCAFFGMRLGVGPRALVGVFLLGGSAWAVTLLASGSASGLLVPVVAAAIVVGLVGQVLAIRARMPSVIWTVPSVLPLLPGLTIVQGIVSVGSIEGVLTTVSAIGTGFALGAGVAFGSIVVTVARQAREVAQTVAIPALTEVRPLWRPGARRIAGDSSRVAGAGSVADEAGPADQP
jgi:uncharacterized membrane protein YjjP (DUF1212 family)